MPALTLLLCLAVIRACIDMQYPVRRKVSRVTGSESWLSEDGEDLKGGIPYYFAGDPLPPGYDLVHFDLDPQNGELCPVMSKTEQMRG